MSLLNYNFDSKLPICNSMILSGDHWCKHASAVHESYSQNKCAIEANIIRFCMSIGQYEIFLNYLEIQEENMENHETVCSVFHTEQTPSPQQFRDPVGGLWLTQPRVPEWNSWDPSGACSRANPASRHKLDTNYTLDVSMCEQRMQETCWTWRKHFWSLEAHRLKLFAKVQHVIGRVAVHWEASKSETGQSTRWRTFFAFKSTVSFSGNSLFSSETVRETCVFFSPGYSEIHDISDIKMRVKQTSVAFTSNTPEFPGLMFCPGTTASFTVPWQLESTESIWNNLDFCKCFISEYTVSQTSVSPCNGSCGPVFHPAFLFGVASKEYNMGVLQLTPCIPAWLWH